jgi:nucleoporin NUP82
MRVIAGRGTEIFVGKGTEVRCADLEDLKARHSPKDMHASKEYKVSYTSLAATTRDAVN